MSGEMTVFKPFDALKYMFTQHDIFVREYSSPCPPKLVKHEDLHFLAAAESRGVVLDDDEPLVAVMGVGYVGTHLINSFSAHYNVLGFDVSTKRVEEAAEEYRENYNVELTSTSSDLSRATHILIAVPTLLRQDKTVDSSSLGSALSMVDKYARVGTTIVIESSVAVGMTRKFLGPMASERGFYAGMSPERVDPGRTEPPMQSIPKIVSGLDNVVAGSSAQIIKLYSRVFDHIEPVSKPEVAEMTKLYENCQRMLCIAYANEMADACAPHGIDPWEVCAAAATKPFGYMPCVPSLGVGGHCIPVNPYYLLSNSSFPLLEAASEKMKNRPAMIAQRALETVWQKTACASDFRTPRLLVVGMGFKAGQSTLCNSPGLDLAKSLVLSKQVDVSWADSLVPQSNIPEIPRLDMLEWSKDGLQQFDMIIGVHKQDGMDFEVIDGLQGVLVEMWCR